MKKVLKYMCITVLIICFNLIVSSNKVEAVLKSNGSAGAAYTRANWISGIRNMETSGQVLGLNATINATTLLDSSASNNLDVHMEKNIEYGAMVILSASSYGNPSKVASGATSTGNSSGAILKINKEMVAAVRTSGTGLSSSLNGRYIDVYAKSLVTKSGDGMLSWHGATNTWNSSSDDYRQGTILRSYSGSIFSYFNQISAGTNRWGGDAYYTRAWYSRAVIVVGQGV